MIIRAAVAGGIQADNMPMPVKVSSPLLSFLGIGEKDLVAILVDDNITSVLRASPEGKYHARPVGAPAAYRAAQVPTTRLSTAEALSCAPLAKRGRDAPMQQE